MYTKQCNMHLCRRPHGEMCLRASVGNKCDITIYTACHDDKRSAGK